VSKQVCSTDCDTCERLRAATLTVVGTDGIDAVSSERIAAEAALALEHSLRHYASARECLYDTYERVAQSIYEDFERCFALEQGWRRALMLAGRTLLERMAARPAEARLCFIQVLKGDHELLRRREANRRRLVDLFVRELGNRREEPEQFRIQLELLIGAAFQAIATAVETGDVAELPELVPELRSRAFVFEPAAA
jgi:AcrR family transcriptional regulator